MKLSIVVVVLNEEARIGRLLESLRAQTVPWESLEVLVADGGSTDRTREIVASYGCTIVENPLRRAEPGVHVAMNRATGDFVMVMAADNPLATPDALATLLEPLANGQAKAAFPRVVCTSRDSLTTRYFNNFTDPFNHFVYWDAGFYEGFRRVYPRTSSTAAYDVFDFSRGPDPLLALAQGFTLARDYDRPEELIEDDVAPVGQLIARGWKIAYVHGAGIEHHTTDDFGVFWKKFSSRIRFRLENRDAPIWNRRQSWTRARHIRSAIWPLYAVSIVGPAVVSIYGAARDRKLIWLMHAPLTTALGAMFAIELTRYAVRKTTRLVFGPRWLSG